MADYCPTEDISNPLKNGILYVISNEKFDNYDDHLGNTVDEKILTETFQHFGFDIEIIKDFNFQDICKKIKEIRSANFNNYKHFALAILTHGDRYGTLSAKDIDYCLDTIIILPILQNPTLKDKLKLFLIEANRGRFDAVVQMTDAKRFHDRYWLQECLRCYAATEGFKVQPRDNNSGSYFIQTFCELLKQHGSTKHIIEIMNGTIEKIKNITEERQIPCYTSCVTKEFIIGKK